MKQKKKSIILHDHVGRELTIGNAVAFFHRGFKMMRTGRVVRLTKVNVTVEWQMTCGGMSRSVRANETIILDDNVYVFHCLQNGLN